MANNYRKIIKELSGSKLKPVYLLHGTEPYYIDIFTEKILAIAIPEHEKGFNEYVLYGKDVTLGDVINYARKFPMMAEKQLVLVKEAHAISDLNSKDSLALLESYAKNPLESTVLVLSFGKPQDERKTWVKSFSTKGEIYNFKKMYDSEIPEFISELCKEEELKISPKAIQLLSEHLGNNPQAIGKEIEKIKVNLKAGEGIDADSIEKYVGVSKDYNVFELQKALIDKNATKAFQIANYFGANAKDHPVTMNVISLYNFFSKVLLIHGLGNRPDSELARILGVNPYFLKDYKRAAQSYSLPQLRRVIRSLRIADGKSKGVDAGNSSDTDLYKELIYGFLS
jgi:DNA polymerase-3 subunit delta